MTPSALSSLFLILPLADRVTEEQAYQYASSPADLKLLFTLSQAI